ncbi:efflux transporter outer membrane subunit [Pseudovibrio japonicus]|uniref:efflux transporter outer membrane subunit n=1 Tax=Pseudovibrio japonicus TaxID=366534 RepID=UPI001AD90691|nr:efflux transporter outer membrane subunit [Pseudovibrio japonicus]
MCLLSVGLALSACVAVGPDPYGEPQIQLANTFVDSKGTSAGNVAVNSFWTEYHDNTLDNLVSRGLAQNLDIIAAKERINAAEADLRGLSPLSSQLFGNTNVARQRGGSDGGPTYTNTTSALGASFVFDLFGGAQRARQGGRARYLSAETQVETTRLAWLAELIAAYSDARYNQQALTLTRSTIKGREGTLQIAQDKLEVGTGNAYDVAQAEALLQTAKADLPVFEAQFNAQVFRIATLLNEPSGPLLGKLQLGAPPLRIPAGPGTGVPADLLRNRPDVLSAQLNLSAAVAEVGVATADLLPSISLTGQVTDISSATSWSFGPQLSLPIFNQGLLRATRDRRASEAKQAEIAWRQSVSSAVEDVQTAQSNLRRYKQRVATLDQAANSYTKAYELALENYQAGSLDLLNLLDADRSRIAAQLSAAAARNDAAKAWSVLQISIGTGANAPSV